MGSRLIQNSALDDVRASYLKQYAVSLSADQKVVNIILEASVTTYAYLPFMIVAGNYISIITVVGNLVEETLTTSGVSATSLVGNEIDAKAIVENGRIRIKCTFSAPSMPIAVYSLRKGITIRELSGSIS